MKGRNAVVIGGSRGIGAATVEMFGCKGADVTFTYARRHAHAEKVSERLREAGANGIASQLDICDDASVDAFIDLASRQDRPVDFLVLAAAGGLEPGRGPDYAFQINDLGPARFVSRFLSCLSENALVIYLTSHEAHFCGTTTPHQSYAPVAASKHAGEERLRSLETLLRSKGANLNVISGDVVPDSATGKLLEYKNPGILEHRRGLVGALPSARDFADRIGLLCATPMRDFGAVSYVWAPVGYPA